jgi:AcrR family transcriptional regulator
VSQTAPYRHFADKRALLAAVAAKGFREFAEGQAAADRQFSDPALRIQAMGVAYVSFATRHPALFRLMFSAEFADKTAYPELFDAGKASFMPFSQAVEERVGNSDTMRVDAGTAKVAGWALVHGLANLLLEGYGGKGITPRLDEPGLVDRATALFVRAIGPEAPDR